MLLLLLLYALLFSFIDKSFNEIACFTLRRASELFRKTMHFHLGMQERSLLLAPIFCRLLPFALYLYPVDCFLNCSFYGNSFHPIPHNI